MRTLVAKGYTIPRDGGRGYRLGPAVQVTQGLTLDSAGYANSPKHSSPRW